MFSVVMGNTLVHPGGWDFRDFSQFYTDNPDMQYLLSVAEFMIKFWAK